MSMSTMLTPESFDGFRGPKHTAPCIGTVSDVCHVIQSSKKGVRIGTVSLIRCSSLCRGLRNSVVAIASFDLILTV